MSPRIQQLKTAWEDRGHRLGLTHQAILFKRFPHWLMYLEVDEQEDQLSRL
jgi:hypothetical protein